MSNKEFVTLEFSYVFVRNGSVHAYGVARRLSMLCIIIQYVLKYLEISLDSQLNHRLSKYTYKHSKKHGAASL